jgi:hypothetical protein
VFRIYIFTVETDILAYNACWVSDGFACWIVCVCVCVITWFVISCLWSETVPVAFWFPLNMIVGEVATLAWRNVRRNTNSEVFHSGSNVYYDLFSYSTVYSGKWWPMFRKNQRSKLPRSYKFVKKSKLCKFYLKMLTQVLHKRLVLVK